MSEYDTCTTQKALSVLHINGQIIKLLLCRLLDPQQTHIHMNALTFQFLCKQRTHADNFQVWPTSLSDTVAHSHQAITTQEPRLCLTSQIHSKWTQVRMTGSATVFLARMLLLERDRVHPYLLPYKFSSDFVWKRIHLHFFSHGLTSHKKKLSALYIVQLAASNHTCWTYDLSSGSSHFPKYNRCIICPLISFNPSNLSSNLFHVWNCRRHHKRRLHRPHLHYW